MTSEKAKAGVEDAAVTWAEEIGSLGILVADSTLTQDDAQLCTPIGNRESRAASNPQLQRMPE
jgi:hypothetical protein